VVALALKTCHFALVCVVPLAGLTCEARGTRIVFLVPLGRQLLLSSSHVEHWDGSFFLEKPKAIVEGSFPQNKKHQVLNNVPFSQTVVVAIGTRALWQEPEIADQGGH
jgi:hypothetical protein